MWNAPDNVIVEAGVLRAWPLVLRRQDNLPQDFSGSHAQYSTRYCAQTGPHELQNTACVGQGTMAPVLARSPNRMLSNSITSYDSDLQDM
jgi:hypothetical protein